MIKIKTLFISDVHLGTNKCQADKLLDVLRNYEYEQLIIIGDFIDLTSLKKKFMQHNFTLCLIFKYFKRFLLIIFF